MDTVEGAKSAVRHENCTCFEAKHTSNIVVERRAVSNIVVKIDKSNNKTKREQRIECVHKRRAS